MRLTDDHMPGYNPAFIKRVMAKRRSVLVASKIKAREDRSARIAMLAVEAKEARAAALAEKERKRLAAELADAERIEAAQGVARASIPSNEYERIERRALLLFGLRRIEILSARRTRILARCRMFICYWTCRRTRLSLPQIGRKMGGRDHTSILHSARRWPELRAAQGRKLRSAR